MTKDLKFMLIIVIWIALEAASIWIVSATFLAFKPYDRIFSNYTPLGIISALGETLMPISNDCNETLARCLLIVSLIFGLISIVGLTLTMMLMLLRDLDSPKLKYWMMSFSFTLVLSCIFANMSSTCISGKELCVDKNRLYSLNMADEFGLGIGFIGSGVFSVL